MREVNHSETAFHRRLARAAIPAIAIAGVLGALLLSQSHAAIPTGRVLAYGPDSKQVIYFYPGAGAGPHKVLVVVHGGGWISGAPDGEREAIPIFMARGFSVVNIGYRLYPQVDGRGEVNDIVQGLAYVIAKSDELALDRHSLALLGHSAGGHLVSLIGTDSQYLDGVHIDPHDVRAVIAVDGIYDLPSWSREKIKAAKPDNVTPVFGPLARDMAQMSPARKISSMRMHPRFCLINEETEFHFADQADVFEAALKAHMEDVERLSVPGLDHMQLFYTFDHQTQQMREFTFRCLGAAGLKIDR